MKHIFAGVKSTGKHILIFVLFLIFYLTSVFLFREYVSDIPPGFPPSGFFNNIPMLLAVAARVFLGVKLLGEEPRQSTLWSFGYIAVIAFLVSLFRF